MNRKGLQRSLFFAVFWILILTVTLMTATYAWFTVSAVTNVEPADRAVSRGDMNLLISAGREGPFEKECTLQPDQNAGELQPVSTADLEHFYEAAAHNGRGIVSLYRRAEGQIPVVHGTLYLRSQYRECDVYLKRTGLDFGADGQMLAAMRLGLKITAQNETKTLIFRLDALGSTAGAQAAVTVPTSGTVVSSVENSGRASFVQDPSEDISDYMAVEEETDDAEPKAGRKKLCTLGVDETAAVEFWLYLEGCDENCINAVQKRDAGLQLSFAGVPADTEDMD